MKKFLAGCAIAALATSAVYAQETTSTIQGTVTANGQPVPNATVRVTHVPSGTVSVATTRADGNFAAYGLRVGGPYQVAVSASGFADYQATDINTDVGQPFSLPVELEPAGQEVVITASRVRGARIVSAGPATVLNADQISQVASINRDIRDLMRRDPFANIDKSSATAAVSFAGQNPRFNRFTIDGVPITDSFGLNPDGLPSRRGPVPLDAIGQFETKVAPYDIREGNFQGGVVNAILKSGTNEFHGTGFYSYTDDSLVGKKTKPFLGGKADGSVTVPKFKNRDFGAEISGPIIKDRLFFMIAAERVRAATPYPYGTVEDNGGVPVTNLTNAQLTQITGIAKSKYSYDAGGIVRNNGDQDDRIVGRIDANISETQRFSLTGIYTKDQLISLTNTGTATLSLGSNSYVKPNKVYAGIAQLNSDWGGGFSTEVRGLYKQYDSGQIPIGKTASQATVCTAATSDRAGAGATDTFNQATSCPTNVAQIALGTGGPSQANELHIKTYGGSVVARLAAGDHNFRALFETQYTKSLNVFVNGALGTYYFDSIADFQAGNAQTFSYTNSPTLDPNNAAAKFNYSTYTFGLQDNWRVNGMLNLSYGLRYDLYGGHSAPARNPIFANRYGFGNDAYINGRGLLQPRLGFDFAPLPRVTIRGGAGIFGGGTPDVYIGNSFSNTGVLSTTLTARLSDQGRTQINGVTNPGGAALLNNVNLAQLPANANPLLQAQGGSNLTSNPNNTTTLNALDPNFKIPSQWRFTLSGRWDADLGPLGDHWRFGVDGFYSKVRNQVAIIDLRSVPIAGSLTPDGRQRYRSVITAAPTDSGADYLLTNSDKGRSYVAVASVSKAWDFGLSSAVSFTYQNVKDNQAFTSSIANSNYSNGAYNDPNSLTGAYGHSNDEVPYAIKYNVSFQHAFYEDYKTRIDLFGETRQGYNYSWGFQDVSSGRSTVFGTVASASRYLFYVPTAGDPLVRYFDTATQTSVENLIATTGLSKYRGKVAPRNAFHSPWFTRLDLHLEQEVPTFVGKSRITLWADVENFTNLLSHKWGQQLRANFPYNKTVVKVACEAVGTNPCGRYVYSSPTSDVSRADSLVNGSLGASLYAVRVGARFSF
ncbi:MAG TPA: carboxypeptidase regulatory-like domain-containing protein [Sphingomonas sp.]|nr:carboxypeptidase regulatory-like domain-containing protein [Sphingomonas sp.]